MRNAEKKLTALRKQLAANLQQLRELRGESQAKAADRIGTSWSMISQVERGVRDPSMAMLALLAAAYDTEPWMLIRPVNGERR